MNQRNRAIANMAVLGWAISMSASLQQAAAQDDDALQRRIDNTVLERGVVEAGETIELRNEVRGKSTVLFMIPDGSSVEKGDLLVSLDDSAISDAYAKQEILLNEATANLQAARGELEVAAAVPQQLVPMAELELKVAELALRRYTGDGGEFAQEVLDADGVIASAKARLRRAALDSELAAKNRNAVEATLAQLATEEAQFALKSAESAKKLLVELAQPHRAAKYELAVAKARTELLRQKKAAETGTAAAQAKVRFHESIAKNEVKKLNELEEQIVRCRIVAPRDGVVLHPPRRGRANTSIEAGTMVTERQVLVQIPDLKQLGVRVLVHESQIDRLRVGQTVKLRMDAAPDQVVKGKLVHVNTSPEARSSFLDEDVVKYSVRVAVIDPPRVMRIGMTVAAEIMVSDKER